VSVTRRYLIAQNQEWAVVIGIRDFNRILEQLDECIPTGWADLWLAAAGAAAALGVSALVGALTLPSTLPGTASMLWTLMAAGAAIFFLCMVGYVTQRRNPGKEIGELKKDLEIHKPAQHLCRTLSHSLARFTGASHRHGTKL
jgi:hypothetical protein